MAKPRESSCIRATHLDHPQWQPCSNSSTNQPFQVWVYVYIKSRINFDFYCLPTAFTGVLLHKMRLARTPPKRGGYSKKKWQRSHTPDAVVVGNDLITSDIRSSQADATFDKLFLSITPDGNFGEDWFKAFEYFGRRICPLGAHTHTHY